MSYTSNFKTKSEYIKRQNLSPQNIYLVALDIGYSGVKGMSANSIFCFPSFTRVQSGEMIGTPRDTDILYKDETGQIYAVGDFALEGLNANDTNDSTSTLFGRNRYFTPSFKILARVGLAMGLQKGEQNGYDGKKPLFLQTGLPPAYRRSDTRLLVEALAGEHRFSVKIGKEEWKEYKFTLPASNISVIDQPIGSVYSASKRNDGTTVATDESGRSYIDSRVLVVDGGFGTLDTFSVMNRSISGSNTFNTHGMKAVFERTANAIFERHGADVQVHTLQNMLESGTVKAFNRRTRSSQLIPFGDILKEKNRAVCNEALDKIEATYNNLIDYDFLLVTGGTCASWLNYIRDRYKGMETLQIITGNQNDPSLSHIYSNVRGYYMYRALTAIRKE